MTEVGEVVLKLLEDGRTVAKLCDLGLVKDVDDEKNTKNIGTRFYSPPVSQFLGRFRTAQESNTTQEVRLEKDWTLKGDIYSFGGMINRDILFHR